MQLDALAQSQGERIGVNKVADNQGKSNYNENGNKDINIGQEQTVVENDDGTFSEISAPLDEVFEHEIDHAVQDLTNAGTFTDVITSSGQKAPNPGEASAVNRTNKYRKDKNRGYSRYCYSCQKPNNP